MVNDEIVGGLKSALERGQSLEKAMLTLFNSGYKKEEIEEAARNLMQFSPESQIQPPIKTVPKSTEIKQAPQILTAPAAIKSFPELEQPKPNKLFQKLYPPQPTPIAPPTIQQPIQPLQIPQSIQKVSGYGEVQQPKEKIKPLKEKRPREKAIIFVLVFLLIFLMGLLGMIFVFKQQLIDFLSNIFG